MVTAGGHLYAMGSNAFGKLGISPKDGEDLLEFFTTPKLVDGLMSRHVTKVSCGWNHTAAITKEGSVFTWG